MAQRDGEGRELVVGCPEPTAEERWTGCVRTRPGSSGPGDGQARPLYQRDEDLKLHRARAVLGVEEVAEHLIERLARWVALEVRAERAERRAVSRRRRQLRVQRSDARGVGWRRNGGLNGDV